MKKSTTQRGIIRIENHKYFPQRPKGTNRKNVASYGSFKNMPQSPIIDGSILHSEDKEFVRGFLKELNIMEQSIEQNEQKRNIDKEPNTEYVKILTKTKAFKNDSEKINYLIKELENASVKMRMLDINIKSLREENEQIKKYSCCKENKGNNPEEIVKLKKEIGYLRSVIADQNYKLDQFKNQVLERFCYKHKH